MAVEPGDGAPQTVPADTAGIDMVEPTAEEVAYVEHVFGRRLPDQHRLAEVESSSRLSVEDDTLVMSSPVLYRDDEGIRLTPVGFVLGPKLLVTLRSAHLKSFDDYVARRRAHDIAKPHNGAEVLLGLMDAIVDRMADGMETVGADLDGVAKHIFAQTNGVARQRPTRVEKRLTKTLQVVGQSGETTSYVRDSLLGLSRLTGFLQANGEPMLSAAAKHQLDTIRQDIASLNDYETRLTDKVQFLLDSTLGFINIQQNQTFKLLTVASVIGIPPTFVVGLYGMNFKHMPEYDWAWGYQWGLLLIVLSIVVPVAWLKVKGWF